jgi:hypothetical protein
MASSGGNAGLTTSATSPSVTSVPTATAGIAPSIPPRTANTGYIGTNGSNTMARQGKLASYLVSSITYK